MARTRKPQPWPGLYTSRPVPGTCSDCGAQILAAHIEGFPSRLDPVPLSGLGELAALLQGSATHLLHQNGRIYRRTRHAIATQTPPIAGLVVRDHRCGNENALGPPFAYEPVTTGERSCDF